MKMSCVHPDCCGKCIEAMHGDEVIVEETDAYGTVYLLGKPYPACIVVDTFSRDMALDAAEKGLRVIDHNIVADGRHLSWWSIHTGEIQK